MGRVDLVAHWVILVFGLVAFPSLLLGGADPDWWTVGFAAVWTLNTAQLWNYYETRYWARRLARAWADAKDKKEADR